MDKSNIGKAIEDIEKELKAKGCQKKDMLRTMLSVEECLNILVQHGTEGGSIEFISKIIPIVVFASTCSLIIFNTTWSNYKYGWRMH